MATDTESDDELGPAPLVRLCRTKDRANWNRTTLARKKQQVRDKEGKTKGMQTRTRVRTQSNTGPPKILQPEKMVPGEEVVTNGEADTPPQQQRNAGQTQEDKAYDQSVTTHNDRQHTTKEISDMEF